MNRAWICLAFAFLVVPALKSRAQSAAPASSQDASSESAAAKAAARKKRFEEQKRRLEGQESAPSSPCDAGKPLLYITPTTASMLIGESRGFTLFDTDGHKLTAAAEWSVSSSYLATITPGGEPSLTAKNEGTFQVIARISGRTAEATVTVYPGDKLPTGTARWTVAPIPSSKCDGAPNTIQQIVGASGSPRPSGATRSASSPPLR